MLILLHILVALSSIITGSYALIRPSTAKLHSTYWLMATTLGTGAYLVINTHAQLVSACTTGLAYLTILSLEIFVARKRLALSHVSE